MAAAAETCMKEGLINIIGGCCGSTPSHIAAIAEKARNYEPRAFLGTHTFSKTIFAGTDILEIDLPACKTFETASRPWQAALDEGDYEEAVEIAREEAEKGLKILAINSDKAPDPFQTIESFIFLAAAYSDLAKLPILIESSSREIIERGLKCFQGRGLVRYIGDI
jgi:5-methyltetrahydrofolate--homocysteine methyltransferase